MNIKALLRILRGQLVLIAAAVVIGALLAIAYGSGQEGYKATAELVLRPTDGSEFVDGRGGPSPFDFDRYVANEVAILRSAPIALAAAANAKIDVGEIYGHFTIATPPQSEVVRISAKTVSPDGATTIANAIAQAYLDARKASAVEVLDRKIKAVQDQEAKLRTDIDAQASTTAGIATRQAAVTQLEQLIGQEAQLTADRALKRGGAELITKALSADQVASVSTLEAIVGGGMGGLLIGVAVSLVTEQVSARVRSVDDLSNLDAAVRIVGEVPYDSHLRAAPAGRPMMLERQRARFSESIRAMRTSVGMLRFDRPVSHVLVTGVSKGDGASTVALNLALAFAQAGTETVLVSADLRAGSVEELLGVKGRPGLVEHVAFGQAEDVTDVLVPTSVPNLSVLRAGRYTPNPAELIASPRTQAALAELRQNYLLVVDSPPVVQYTDAVILASYADAVLLVASAGRTRVEELRRAMDSLSGSAFPSVGVVLNRVK